MLAYRGYGVREIRFGLCLVGTEDLYAQLFDRRKTFHLAEQVHSLCS